LARATARSASSTLASATSANTFSVAGSMTVRLSVVIGMLMAFVFAEIASMFPEKTGGIPIFASVAYRKYTPLVGPVVTWGYWFAWSPVLAINGLLVGGYVNALAIHSTNAWINWLIGAVVLVVFFAINHYGIKQGAYAQLVLGICAILPLLLLGIVPWFHGQVDFARFSPFAPLGGGWGSFQGWVNVFGALFVAGWSAYAFETAVAYCAEFRNPKADAPRAILSSGLLSLVCFSLVPLALIGALGMKAIVQDPSVALVPLAKEVFGGAGGQIIIVLLIVALLLSTNTAMMAVLARLGGGHGGDRNVVCFRSQFWLHYPAACGSGSPRWPLVCLPSRHFRCWPRRRTGRPITRTIPGPATMRASPASPG